MSLRTCSPAVRVRSRPSRSRLLDGGALGAVMSGTGSAVFGLFADADSAAYAKRRLARDYAECFLTETIDRLEV